MSFRKDAGTFLLDCSGKILENGFLDLFPRQLPWKVVDWIVGQERAGGAGVLRMEAW